MSWSRKTVIWSGGGDVRGDDSLGGGGEIEGSTDLRVRTSLWPFAILSCVTRYGDMEASDWGPGHWTEERQGTTRAPLL